MKTASALYNGSVMHRRLKPRKHRLKYRMFQFLLDLDEVDALGDRLFLFSRNRFNIFMATVPALARACTSSGRCAPRASSPMAARSAC